MLIKTVIAFRSIEISEFIPSITHAAEQQGLITEMRAIADLPPEFGGFRRLITEAVSGGGTPPKYDQLLVLGDDFNKYENAGGNGFSIPPPRHETEKARLISFFRDLFFIISGSEFHLAFLFGDDFETERQVLVRFGTFEQMVNFLKLPEFWTLDIWHPQSNTIQEFDDWPLIYFVNS